MNCPKCGVVLQSENAKFCSECGSPISFNPKKGTKKTPVEEDIKTSIFELGQKLEEVVEKIYRAKGYSTERRQRLQGESGTRNEIDIIARRGSRTIAIECKNHSYPVGIDEVRDFNQKLQDLGLQGVFVAYRGLTTGAAQFAESQNIDILDNGELMEKWWALSVGREKGEIQEVFSSRIEYALPLNVDFNRATKVNLSNSGKVKVSSVELIFHPYHAISYKFKAQKRDPTKKIHKFEDSDTLFVDALDGSILNPLPQKSLGGSLIKAIKSISSATAHAENDRAIKLLRELGNIELSQEYTVESKGNYEINKLNALVSPHQAIDFCYEFIIEKNTQKIAYYPKSQRDSIFSESNTITFIPKKSEIRIIKKDMVLIPRWSVEFEAIDKIYQREVLAYSGITLEDTMVFCPNHFKVGAITIAPKSTVAVCENCGQSLCEKHVKPCHTCGKWLCEEHGVDCQICQNRFCNSHQLITCPICHEPICPSCTVTCPICGKKYGKDHTMLCQSCGSTVCPDCMITSGFLRKTRTCKKCIK
jgi:hypothetical protein